MEYKNKSIEPLIKEEIMSTLKLELAEHIVTQFRPFLDMADDRVSEKAYEAVEDVLEGFLSSATYKRHIRDWDMYLTLARDEVTKLKRAAS